MDKLDSQLSVEQLILVAWYRSLTDIERATVDMLVHAFAEKGHQPLECVNIQAFLSGFDERPLAVA